MLRLAPRSSGLQAATKPTQPTMSSCEFLSIYKHQNVSDLLIFARTLDEVLLSLRDRNIAELHADQRNAANARVQRAYRVMYDKEDCEKFETALKLLRSAKRDLHLVAEDIHSK
jgi:hypothetical protein